MKLSWTTFSGIRPQVDVRLLPDGNAQVAENVDTDSGGLRPLAGLKDVLALAKTNVKTIYRFGQDLQSATLYWFSWDTWVSVVKGPIANDTAERTYWTGDGAPKYTTNLIGTTGANLPSASRPLGISAPALAPQLMPAGDPPEGAGAETRVYIYTLVTDNSEESAPSAPGTVEIVTGQGVRLESLATTADNGAVVSTKRIYRAQRGVYLFVAEISGAETTYTDTLGSESLGEVCPSISWDTPPETLASLTSGANGMLAGIDGYTVRFCEPFFCHAWPMDYSQTVPYSCVALSHFGSTFVVLTTGYPFLMTGEHPSNISSVPAKFYQPCLSATSVVTTEGDVLWASPDGLVSLGSSGERNLTEGVFTPKQWRALSPETLIGAWHEGWYVGSYDNGAGRRGFMFRPGTKEWIDLPQLAATAFYRDTVGDALYACVDDRIQQFRAGDAMAYRWKSPQVVTPMTDFVVARVTGDYPVTFKLYKNQVLAFTKEVQSDEPFKMPPRLSRSWEIEVSGTNPVLGVVLSSAERDI